MSDDLVKRARCLNECYADLRDYWDTLLECADRIEALEAALDDMSQYVSRADWHYLKDETRKALEGKDE